MANRDAAAFKTLLRTASHRLGQLQERKDSQGQITRRDIATLLHDGHTGLARAKAHKLMQEDRTGDLLEVLEMCVGVVLEHMDGLDASGQHSSSSSSSGSLSPVAIEAAATIVYAAPATESKDLHLVRDMLVQRLGRDFARSAATNAEKTVSPQVVDILSSPAPTAAQMDAYLVKIANAYDVKWAPEPRRQDILDRLSEVLDPKTSPVVDLPRLRKLCSNGLPDDPPWVRPRIWRLLFGTLPVLKATWTKESGKQRDSYYDLVRRLLPPLSTLPPPSSPLAHADATILRVSESLFRLPPEMFALLEDEPENYSLCPLDETAEESIRITCARDLDLRMQLVRQASNSNEPEAPGIPEIRLESDVQSLPSDASQGDETHTTLLQAKSFDAPPAHPKHLSALFRLLYLHACLNPANQAPHIPALLVPLYSALTREVEPADAAHAEADTFWLFEALVGELVELEDEEGGKVWMRRFSGRLAIADPELSENLQAKSLDPALPHYSYRWLGSLLTQTLPLSAVFPVWDVIFACPMRTRDANPKLDRLVDVCVSLLVRARTPLFRLGNPGRQTAGLWADENGVLPPLSPLRPWELNDAFMEGMALFKEYPIRAAGGIDRVLQTASDISQQRMGQASVKPTEGATLGERLKATVWKGFVGTDEEDEDDLEEEEEAYDDGNETETPAGQSLTSRLANTVWRGITNQSSMDDEMPSPESSPSPPLPPEEDIHPQPVQHTQSSLWDYAGKLKNSDTVATFSKVSTNWRAKAMNAWSSRRNSGASPSTLDVSSPRSISSELPPMKGAWPSGGGLDTHPATIPRSSSCTPEVDGFANPPRPAVFRSPRESFLPQPRRQASTAPTSPQMSPDSDSAFIHKAKTSLASLASFQMRSAPATKSGPRPLLLNSQTLMTAPKPPPSSHSDGGTPPYRQGQWSDVLPKGHVMRQESVSSSSSVSLSATLDRTYPRSVGSRSDYDSDGNSRRVPLNRKISPMALASRSPRLAWSGSSAHSSDASVSSTRGHLPASGNITEEIPSERGWRPVDAPDSPTTVPSPPPPPTPLNQCTTPVRVKGVDHVSISVSEPVAVPLEPPARSGAIIRKRTPPPVHHGNEMGDTSDSSASLTPSRPRVRSKRYVSRPATLRIRDTLKPSTAVPEQQKSASPRSSLAPEWLEEPELTPRAGHFGGSDPSSASTTSPVSPRRSPSGNDVRLRKGSADSYVRPRKVSTSSREVRKSRDSGAEEGDDEGYDELLSAYESEEGKE